jgi:FkbM family methyltransferase
MKNKLQALMLLLDIAKVTGMTEALRLMMRSRSRNPILRFRYKGNLICINNDKPALFHIAYSIPKLEKLVNALTDSSLDVVIDVGANTGLFSYFIKMKYPACRIYLIEPASELNGIIEENMKRFDNWSLHSIGISNESLESVPFFINDGSQQTNSLVRKAVESAIARDQNVRTVSIRTQTLDDFCEEQKISSIDVLKVDIQWAEPLLIRGGSKALSNTRKAFFEICFLDTNINHTMNLLDNYFKGYDTINEVKMGADLLYHK